MNAGARLLAIALTAAVVAGHASAEIVVLRDIPEGSAFSADKSELAVEKSRLEHYLSGLQRMGAALITDCKHVLRGSQQWNSCKARQDDLEAKKGLYNLEADRFNASVSELLRRIRQRQKALSSNVGVDVQSAQALDEANRKTNHVLDALEHGKGDWQRSLTFLRNRAAQHPNDPALRDALTYLEGMYQGHLRAKDLANKYYHFGVRHWLRKDFTMAARAFAEASRNNPDDLEVFRSFAFATGQQHGSEECRSAGLCVATELPRWAAFFGPEHGVVIESLEAQVKEDPANRRLRDSLNHLKGISVYAANVDCPQQISPAVHRLTTQAISHAQHGNYLAAAELYAEAWQAQQGDRAMLFLWHYHEGIAKAQGDPAAAPPTQLMMEELEAHMLRELSQRLAPAPREMRKDLAQNAFKALQSAFKKSKEHIPFFGMLSADEITRLTQEF